MKRTCRWRLWSENNESPDPLGGPGLTLWERSAGAEFCFGDEVVVLDDRFVLLGCFG